MTKWQRGVYVSLLEYRDVAVVRHARPSFRDTGISSALWSHTMLSSTGDTRMLKDKRSGSKTRGRKWWGLSGVSWRERKREDTREREREMGEEEGSSLCQAPLAQETHAYAALLLLLPLQPSPTPTPWHYLVKQSWRDESGKRQGLPSLCTARVGLLGWDNTAWLYAHTYTE